MTLVEGSPMADDQTPRSEHEHRWDTFDFTTGAAACIDCNAIRDQTPRSDEAGRTFCDACTDLYADDVKRTGGFIPTEVVRHAPGQHLYARLASQHAAAVEGLRAEGTSIEDIQARLNGGYVGFKVPVMMAAADVSSLLAVIRRLTASQPSRDEG